MTGTGIATEGDAGSAAPSGLSPAARRVLTAVADRFDGRYQFQIDVAELRKFMSASTVPVTTTIASIADHVVIDEDGHRIGVRIYRPRDAEDLPVIQFMHSGGFAIGGLDQNEEYLRRLALATDAVIVSVDYRLAPENPFPAGYLDCRSVWAWINAGDENIGGTPSARAIMGESAGGVLTFALLATIADAGLPMPDVAVNLYGTPDTGVSDPELATALLSPADVDRYWDLYLRSADHRDDPAARPVLADNLAAWPPCLVVTPEIDATRTTLEAFARRLSAAGVRVRCERLPGVMHGFATMLDRLPEADEVFRQTADYLRGEFRRTAKPLAPVLQESEERS